MPRIAACKAIAGHPGVLRFQDFVINTDVIVLSTPEIAGLPYVISGLVAAGGLAAALSTADGLLLAIANALSHDIYYKMIDPERADHPSAHGGPRALVLRGRGVGGAGRDEAIGHPGHGGLGVLARHGRQLPGARARHLVEARHHDGRHLRDHRRMGHLPVLPRDLEVLPADGRDLLRHDVAAQPGDRQAAGRHRQGHGRSAMDGPSGRRCAANPLANRVGWFDLNNINCGLLGMPLGFLVISWSA